MRRPVPRASYGKRNLAPEDRLIILASVDNFFFFQMFPAAAPDSSR